MVSLTILISDFSHFLGVSSVFNLPGCPGLGWQTFYEGRWSCFRELFTCSGIWVLSLPCDGMMGLKLPETAGPAPPTDRDDFIDLPLLAIKSMHQNLSISSWCPIWAANAQSHWWFSKTKTKLQQVRKTMPLSNFHTQTTNQYPLDASRIWQILTPDLADTEDLGAGDTDLCLFFEADRLLGTGFFTSRYWFW